MNYGAWIRCLRESRGLKAKFVAQKIGISPVQYSALEHGRKKLTADLVPKLADVFGLSADDILRPQVGETRTDEQAATLDPTGTEGGDPR